NDSKTASLLYGGTSFLYNSIISGYIAAGNSQLALTLPSATSLLEDKNVIHLKDASAFFVSLLITKPFEKKCVAFFLFPGSTAISQLKSAFSLKVGNAQDPVTIIPNLPEMKRSQSPIPAIWASVGITLYFNTLSTIYCKVSMFSGLFTV